MALGHAGVGVSKSLTKFPPLFECLGNNLNQFKLNGRDSFEFEHSISKQAYSFQRVNYISEQLGNILCNDSVKFLNLELQCKEKTGYNSASSVWSQPSYN